MNVWETVVNTLEGKKYFLPKWDGSKLIITANYYEKEKKKAKPKVYVENAPKSTKKEQAIAQLVKQYRRFVTKIEGIRLYGVDFCTRRCKWSAKGKWQEKTYNLYYGDDKKEAIAARRAWEKKVHDLYAKKLALLQSDE